MAEASVAVASAVLPPETGNQAEAPGTSLKRRQSRTSSPESKRRRVSQHFVKSEPQQEATSPSQTSRETRLNEQRRHGKLEERKRGQRLFGALLGTLSQSSSSTAQKRRADIENKQRAKLRSQTEEENERRRAKVEGLTEVRRRKQRIFDRQSIKIKHSNILAQAHFLQTRAEPRLFYKPWELLPGEEENIEKQLKEAKEVVNQELQEFELDHRKSSTINHRAAETGATEHLSENDIDNGKATDTGRVEKIQKADTNRNNVAIPEKPSRSSGPSEKLKDSQDDGGEVVEGEEDTVIY